MYITIYNLYTTSLMDIALDNIQSLQTYQESGLKKKSTLTLYYYFIAFLYIF